MHLDALQASQGESTDKENVASNRRPQVHLILDDVLADLQVPILFRVGTVGGQLDGHLGSVEVGLDGQPTLDISVLLDHDVLQGLGVLGQLPNVHGALVKHSLPGARITFGRS